MVIFHHAVDIFNLFDLISPIYASVYCTCLYTLLHILWVIIILECVSVFGFAKFFYFLKSKMLFPEKVILKHLHINFHRQ